MENKNDSLEWIQNTENLVEDKRHIESNFYLNNSLLLSDSSRVHTEYRKIVGVNKKSC